MKKRMRRGLIIVSVFLIALGSIQAAYGAPSDFNNLKGKETAGKVKISVESYQEVNGQLVSTPGMVRIKVGDDTSYIPVITNNGSDCNLRLRVYANTGDKSINILKYCYGWQDNWTMKDNWFYYKKQFEKDESVEICRGFKFPDEWQWRECNIMGITVEAEAVADEDAAMGRIVKTGDNTHASLLVALMLLSLAGVGILRRRNDGSKDI